MKWLAGCLLALCLTISLPIVGMASAIPKELYDQLGINQLAQEIPPEADEFAEAMGIDLGSLSLGEVLSLSPSTLWQGIKQGLASAIGQARAQLFSVLAAVLLCALLSVSGVEGGSAFAFGLIANLTILAVLIDPLIRCITLSASTLRSVAQFMLAYVPVYATVAATGGAPATAGAYQLIVLGGAQVVSQLAATVLLPLLQCYLVLSFAGGIGKNPGIKSLSGGIKKVVNWSLVLLMTCFGGLLSLQSFLGAAADTATIKTVKFLAGSFIPVIGSAVTDAWSALQGGIQVIHASVGSFGIVVVVCTFLPALLMVGILRAVVAFSAMTGELLSAGEVSDILSGCANVLSVLMALLISMLLLSVISTATLLFLCQGGVG